MKFFDSLVAVRMNELKQSPLHADEVQKRTKKADKKVSKETVKKASLSY